METISGRRNDDLLPACATIWSEKKQEYEILVPAAASSRELVRRPEPHPENRRVLQKAVVVAALVAATGSLVAAAIAPVVAFLASYYTTTKTHEICFDADGAYDKVATLPASDRVEGYRAYIANFPSCGYREYAEIQLRNLVDGDPLSPPTGANGAGRGLAWADQQIWSAGRTIQLRGDPTIFHVAPGYTITIAVMQGEVTLVRDDLKIRIVSGPGHPALQVFSVTGNSRWVLSSKQGRWADVVVCALEPGDRRGQPCPVAERVADTP